MENCESGEGVKDVDDYGRLYNAVIQAVKENAQGMSQVKVKDALKSVLNAFDSAVHEVNSVKVADEALERLKERALRE